MNKYLKIFSLKKKVAFVCGGVGLIGKESSRALAGAGAKVIVLDVDRRCAKHLVKDIVRAGGEAYFEFFDMTEMDTVEQYIKAFVKKYGGPDVWVNLAYPKTKDWGVSLEEVKCLSLQKNIDMQLSAVAWLSRCVALLMKKKKIKGSIINFGSIYGVQANDFTIYEGTQLTSPMGYAMVKAGVINLTRYLASYFGQDQIRANSICPGGIKDNQNKKFIRQYEKKVPLKRMGCPEDIASVVMFLASDASSYITGETMMVDGGWTIV